MPAGDRHGSRRFRFDISTQRQRTHPCPDSLCRKKNHWKDRLAHRIDKQITRVASEDPNLLERVKRQARERALQSLDLAELQQQVDALEKDEEVLEKREGQLKLAMLARVRGVPFETIDDDYSVYAKSRFDSEIEQAITCRVGVYEEDFMAESDVGRRIVTLRRERENLLDTIWLATSPVQLKTVWSKLAELLGDEQTQVQRDALAIEPVTD